MIEIVRMWSDPSCSIIFHFQLSIEYAGVVELVDSTDLGAVTSVKVFSPLCRCNLSFSSVKS